LKTNQFRNRPSLSWARTFEVQESTKNKTKAKTNQSTKHTNIKIYKRKNVERVASSAIPNFEAKDTIVVCHHRCGMQIWLAGNATALLEPNNFEWESVIKNTFPETNSAFYWLLK